VYAALYHRENTTMHETVPGMVTTPEALCTLVTERTLFVGSGVRLYAPFFTARLGAQAICLERFAEGTLAASVAQLGQARLGTSGPPGSTVLKPLYIRAADARLPRHPPIVAEHASPSEETAAGG